MAPLQRLHSPSNSTSGGVSVGDSKANVLVIELVEVQEEQELR